MAVVLTVASNVTCGHGPGRVTTVGSPKLKINGSPVLLASGIAGKAVGGCATPASTESAPCTTVASVTGGEASRLTVGGQPVVLDTLSGTTNGVVAKTTPQTLLAATAGQVTCTAI